MRVTCCSLLISCAAVVALSGPAGGQAPAASGQPAEGTHTLNGVVTDSARQPLSDVEITATVARGETNRATRTDSRGRFEIAALPSGKLSLEARRLGYASKTVEVDVSASDATTSVEIVLTAVPEELQSVEVTAAAQGKLRGFYQRRQQRGTFARFLEEDEIRRLNPRIASDLFRTVPGVRLANNQSGGNAIRIRGCQPMVWIDDQRVPGAELDDMVLPSDIAAIEFYPSAAGIPAQYLERGNRLCGLILVWTKTS
jgi:hypothetical protein